MDKRLISMILLLALAGCDKGQEQAQKKAETENQEPVLARVNGRPIYAFELETALQRTLPGQKGRVMDEALQEKLLQSLVASRVMAQKASQAMSESQLAELDRKVQAWREEQLVKKYLADHVTPQPVSDEKVKEYYRQHPELFGGGQRYQFESLTVAFDDNDVLRDQALDVLAEAEEAKSWRQFADKHSRAALVIKHEHLMADKSLANKNRLARLQAMQPGQVSSLAIEQGEVSVLRLNQSETVAPRPLIEVRGDIRKRLAPMQLRKAVKQAMEHALQDADIEYLQDGQD